jgi:hypothetical protein
MPDDRDQAVAPPPAAPPGHRSMPAADVIPALRYPDLAGAVAWLVTAFGFRQRLRIGGHRAQLTDDRA